jgi:hypothetical protein
MGTMREVFEGATLDPFAEEPFRDHANQVAALKRARKLAASLEEQFRLIAGYQQARHDATFLFLRNRGIEAVVGAEADAMKDREIEAYRYANAVGTVQEQIDRALRSLKKA